MKTQTILNAMNEAGDRCSYYFYRNGIETDEIDKEHLKAIRQFRKFHATVLYQIEQGDKAREALKEVEWIFDDRSGIICPWCHGRRHYLGHLPDCPRQIALGVEK